MLNRRSTITTFAQKDGDGPTGRSGDEQVPKHGTSSQWEETKAQLVRIGS